MLTESIQGLIDTFVEGLLATVRSASLEELTAGSSRKERPPPPGAADLGRNLDPAFVRSKAKPGRLQRRSAEQIQEILGSIVSLLRRHKDGLRSEQIRSELGLSAREMPRVIQQGLSDKTVQILSGEKRATTYGVVGSHKTKKAPKKVKAAPKAKSTKPKAKKVKAVKKAPSKSVSKKTAPAAAAA